VILVIISPLTNQIPGNFNCCKTITKNLEHGTRELKAVVKFIKIKNGVLYQLTSNSETP